jgi:outer membrane protein assembly factor BamE (lipoprotein component of BamABCDE complex)
MQKNPSILPLLACALIGGAAVAGLSSCDKQGNAEVTAGNVKLTPANVAKLSKGMSRAQVIALFGAPTQSGDVENDVIFKKQRVTYIEGKESLSITYKNDEVEEFNSTVGTTTVDGNGNKTTTSSTTTKSE